ncbi:ras-related protein ced-10-like [Entamoeba marina]
MDKSKKYKLVFVGPRSKGKTSLLFRYANNTYSDYYVPVIFDYQDINLNINNKTIVMGLWDTVTDYDHNRLKMLSFPLTDMFFICFAIDDVLLYQQQMKREYDDIKEHCPESHVILVGLRSDLRQENKSSINVVNLEDVIIFAKELGVVNYIECSAKSGENVKFLFEFVAQYLLEHPVCHGNDNINKKSRQCVIV